jgi:VanZ family protein
MQITKHLSAHKNKIIYFAVLWTLAVTFACLVSFNKVPTISIKNIDKLVHVCFHFGIAFLWMLYFVIQKNIPKKKAAIKAFVLSLFLGIIIEICQHVFTTTRRADFLDVIANTIGALLAIGLLFFTSNFIKHLFHQA